MPTRTYPNLGKPVIAWTPKDLFVYGADGAWYDPTDLSTLWQDAAGTIPVTSLGEPVGLMLDKSGKGRHVSQAVAAYRPQLARWPRGGRRNLLTWTEDLTLTDWSKVACGVSAVGDGSFKITPAEATTAIAPYGIGVRQPAAARGLFSGAGATNSFSVEMKAGELGVGILLFYTAANVYGGVAVNLTTGVILEATGANLAGAITLGTCTPVVGDTGWYRLSFTHSQTGALALGGSTFSVSCAPLGLIRYLNYVPVNTTYDGASGVFVRKPQMTGVSNLTPYQKVTTDSDVTEAGVPDVWSLRFDGVDDILASAGSLNFGPASKYEAASVLSNFTATGPAGNYTMFGLHTTNTRFQITARSQSTAFTTGTLVRGNGGAAPGLYAPFATYDRTTPLIAAGSFADAMETLFVTQRGITADYAQAADITGAAAAPINVGAGASQFGWNFSGGVLLARPIEQGERLALRKYLANKIGVAA